MAVTELLIVWAFLLSIVFLANWISPLEQV